MNIHQAYIALRATVFAFMLLLTGCVALSRVTSEPNSGDIVRLHDANQTNTSYVVITTTSHTTSTELSNNVVEPLTVFGGYAPPECATKIEQLLQNYPMRNFIYPRFTRDEILLKMAGDEARRHINAVAPLENYQIQLDNDVLALIDHLPQAPGERSEAIKRWLNDHNLLCTATPSCPAFLEQNVDTDKELEYVFTIGLRQTHCGPGSYEPTQRVYILDCQQNTTNCSVARIGRIQDGSYSACVNIADSNNDSYPELTVNYQYCGATHCWDNLEIAGTTENGFTSRYLLPTLNVWDGCFARQDLNGDGVDEVLAFEDSYHGSADNTGRPWTGQLPDHLEIYTWDGVEYVLADRFYTNECTYQSIAAGIEWAIGEEYEQAVAAFRQVIDKANEPTFCIPPYEEGYSWSAYAYFATGVLQARLGNLQAATRAFLHVQDFDPDRLFTPLAGVFLTTYEKATYAAACDVVAEQMKTKPKNAAFYGPYPARPLLPFCP